MNSKVLLFGYILALAIVLSGCFNCEKELTRLQNLAFKMKVIESKFEDHTAFISGIDSTGSMRKEAFISFSHHLEMLVQPDDSFIKVSGSNEFFLKKVNGIKAKFIFDCKTYGHLKEVDSSSVLPSPPTTKPKKHIP